MAGFKKVYTSQNQYLEDVAVSTGLFDADYYETLKSKGNDLDYLAIIAKASEGTSSSFDKTVYDKLSGEDRFNYYITENILDKTSKEYKQNSQYFEQQIDKIKIDEINSSLGGFEKAMATFSGWVGSLLLGAYSSLEGLIDLGGLLVGNKDFVAKDITGHSAAEKALNDFRQTYTFENTQQWLGAINDVFGAIGQMAPMLVTGGAGGVAKAVGTGIYYGAMAGSTAEEAVKQNPDINYWTLLGYTGAMTGLEAGTEWLSGKVFGEGLIGVTGFNPKQISGGMFKTLLHNMGTEAAEEAVSELFGGVLEYWMVTQDRESLPTLDKVLYASLIGGLTGGFLAGGRIALTPRMSVTESGELKYTRDLAEQEGKKVKNLGLSKSWGLQNLITQTNEALNTPDNITKLMTKHSNMSLEQIKADYSDEYNSALEKDNRLKESQAKSFLSLAKLMNQIGEQNFKEAVDLLNLAAEDALKMVDNYMNHRDVGNKKASEVFSATFPNRNFTPSAIPSKQNQALAEAMRTAFPNIKVVFGSFGDKNGNPVRAINGAETYIFLDENYVNNKGFESALVEGIRYQLADQLLNELNVFDTVLVDRIVNLFIDADKIPVSKLSGDKVHYSGLSREQKLTIAQMLCFDDVNTRKLFRHSNDTHKKLFNYFTSQAELVNKFGRKTKANTIRYRELLKIRNMYLRNIADTIGNAADVQAIITKYELSEDEAKTKITDKMRSNAINNKLMLTEINQVKEVIQKQDAFNELLEATDLADTSEDFDFSVMYSEWYYPKEFTQKIMKNNTNFKSALKSYILDKYGIVFIDKAEFEVVCDQILTIDMVNDFSEKFITPEFLNIAQDYRSRRAVVIDALYFLSQSGTDKNGDSVIVTDNQIQGTGKLRYFKGDIYGRYSDGNKNQIRSASLDTDGQTQRMVSANRRHEETTYGPLKIKEQNADTLENYQKELVKITQEMYGVNLHFYEGSAQNTEDPYVDDLQGFYIRSAKDIFVQDDSTKSQKDILETIRHEIVHFLIFANDDAYQTLLTEIKEINKKSKDKPFSLIKGNISREYTNMPDSVLDEESVVEIIAKYSDVDENTFREKASRSWHGKQAVETTMAVYTKINRAIDDFYKNVMQNKSNWLLTGRSDDIIRTKLTHFDQQSSNDNNYRTLTQEQQNYFKDTVVRDDFGDLLTMYHGSKSKKFHEFTPQEKIANGRVLGDGYYFTTTETGARYFGSETIFEVYLNVKNPLDLRNNNLNAQHILDEYFQEEWVGAKQLGLEYIQDKLDSVSGTIDLLRLIAERHGVKVSDIVKDMGYDGIILYPEDGRLEDSDTQIVVYDSNQIKEVTNKTPTESKDIRYSIKQQNKQETSIQQKINKAESPKQIADVITAIIEAAPLEMSETKGYGDEGTRMYKKTSDEMRRKYASLWAKITQENYDKIRNELVKSDYEYADEALLIFDRFTRAYSQLSTKFDAETKEKILKNASKKQTIAAISQGLQSAELANEHSFGEISAKFEEDGYQVKVSDQTVAQYVPEMANKKEFVKQLDKEISDIEEQIKTAETDLDAAELNTQLDKTIEKRIVMAEGTNEEVMDWVIKNEDIVTKASKLQKEVFEQMVEKGEKAAETPGKKAITILVDEKTGLPKPFPKATKFIEDSVKKLKSFRMWAMLTSPVSWVRNWVGNAGMTALDSMTNSLEKFIASKQSRMTETDLAKLEKQYKELASKEKPTDIDKVKMAQLSNQMERYYDFKFVETKASKELRTKIANDYKDVIQQILNGEDVKYESSAEKAAAITRAERKITRASQNANLGQKLWAACQSMTDWGLNTGIFGDNAVVVNSLIKNFANMVESNKSYLMTSLKTDFGTSGRGMSDARKKLVQKALQTQNSIDIVNAMSKADVELFMDSCKQRTFEQYFKNSNWLSQWASNLSKKHPIAASLTSLVLPFPKVAANILSMTYKYSPLGFLSAIRQWSVVKQMDAEGYAGVRDAFARAKAGRTTAQATVGSFMMLAGLILAALGFVDIDEDDYLGPSLKMGDFKISLSNLAPSMTTFSVGSAMLWAWKNDKSATLQALNVLYDNTLLGNIENVFKYGSPDKYIENLSINYFSQYVPAMLKLFAKFTTNQELIDKSGSYWEKLGKTFGSGIPFVANALPKKINPYTGEVVTGTGSQNVFFNFIEALSPLDFRSTSKPATQKEAERLGTESSGLSGTFKVNDIEYNIDKVTYGKYRANYIEENFEKILSGKQKVTVEDDKGKRITTTYDKLNDKQKKNVINRLYTDATSMTKIKWWTDQGNTYVVTDRDLYKEYRKMFSNIVYKKNWSKSKFVES
jgi:hypothetical protein